MKGNTVTSPASKKRFWTPFMKALVVQIAGGFVAGVLLTWWAKDTAGSVQEEIEACRQEKAVLVQEKAALIQEKAKLIQEEQVLASRLPDKALGNFLAFFIVEAATGGQLEKIQFSKEFDLEIRSGGLDSDSRGDFVTKLEIGLRADRGARPAIEVRKARLSGQRFIYNYPDLHCSFRLDVMTAEAFFRKNKYIISIGSSDLVGDPKPCLHSFNPVP